MPNQVNDREVRLAALFSELRDGLSQFQNCPVVEINTQGFGGEVDPEPETAGTGWLVMVWRQRVKRREGAQGERLGFSPATEFSRGVDGEAAASPPFRPLVG